METRPPSPWFTAITCSVFVLIAAGVVLTMLRNEMMTQMAEQMETSREGPQKTIDALSKRVAELEAKTTALSTAQQTPTTPDTTATDALNAQLMASNAEIAALTARVEMVEKQPAPAPVAPAPVTVITPQPIAAATPVVVDAPLTATVPVATADEGLRRDLQRILAQVVTPAEPIKDNSLAGRINSRFTGFISVKKRTETDVYATLRREAATADMPTLMRHVIALPPAARAPFADWLIAVQTRPAATPIPDAPSPLTTE